MSKEQIRLICIIQMRLKNRNYNYNSFHCVQNCLKLNYCEFKIQLSDEMYYLENYPS